MERKINCPNCGKKIDEWRTYCPYCEEKVKEESRKYTNADKLNIFANIILIIGIIISVLIFICFSTTKVLSDPTLELYRSEINWIGIISSIISFISTLSFYYLCKTIVDIYRKNKI